MWVPAGGQQFCPGTADRSARVEGKISAVNGQACAGHHRRRITGQEHHRSDDVLRLGEPADRNTAQKSFH